MRFLTKVTLGLAALLISITIAPATKADSITISSGGFSLSDLGNNGGGVPGMDSLLGTAASAGQTINGSGSFVALLNPLTFTTAFTGHGSEGTYNFNFAQDVTIDGVTQTLNIAGTIDIGTFVDTVHILSSDPLTFNFGTFSVDVNVLPTSIEGIGPGEFSDFLKAQFVIRTETEPTATPEPATLSLLGLGLAGVAAKLRQRRKSSHSQVT
ncbi:MAG: hypothetical protein DMF75_16830 [Acidobacteria bacterium]|nr:MAG: hypothetical protein DMF75_16830 [Acidobacteriota bacterium]